jgi:hypothetical protein
LKRSYGEVNTYIAKSMQAWRPALGQSLHWTALGKGTDDAPWIRVTDICYIRNHFLTLRGVEKI